MKKLFLCIIIAIMAIPLLSCSDEEPAPPAAIDFVGGQGGQDDSSLNFSHQSSTQNVVFSSNYDWTATPSDEWIKVTPESGKAGEKCEIVVSLDANDTYEKRSGSIVINAKELYVVLTVSQEQNNAIILSTPTVNLPQAGGAFTVKLKANIDYEYEIKADWIKSVETRALTEHSLRFEAEANPSFDKREGEILIKGDGFSETVTVTQTQTNVITLSTTQQNFACSGGEFSVEVQHNVDYKVEISDSWVTQIESRAVKTSALHFAVAENTTYGERKSTITIKGGDITETITVVQTQNNAIILSTPTVNLPQAGGAFTVKLKANIDYEYEIKADWIKSVETRALTEHSLRFEAEANPSFDKREGEILIKGDGFSETVTVTQTQTNVITLSTTQQNFACSGGEFSVEVQHNVDYKVEISDSWVTQIESRAVETTTLHFAVAENTTEERRTATITISGGNITEVITVSQDSLSPQNNELYYTSSDGKIIEPYQTMGFSANIVSNTYSNGRGVIVFDKAITAISEYAFYECSRLTSVHIPNSIIKIREYAFYKTALTKIKIPDSVTEIESYAFNGCTSLTSVTISGNCSVTSIGDSAFGGCSSLTGTYVNITDLAAYAISNNAYRFPGNKHLLVNGTEITELVIPDSVTKIGNRAFYYYASLTSITIPDSVTSIGNSAFSGCKSLTIATIGNGVTSIEEAAFYNCKKLKSATIGNSVTSIENNAFSGCTSLTSIIIPDSVTEIGNNAFSGCISLTSVTIPDSVTSIGDSAFSYCTSPKRVEISDLSAWCKISFESGDANPLCFGAKLYLNGSELTDITIPSDITEIKAYAFRGCTSLTSVTIGNSVTSIGRAAFEDCTSLTSIAIPDSVTSIGSYAFYDCCSLKSITIPDSVTSIGLNAFYGCTGELIVDCMIPSPSVDIKGAFYGSYFTKVTIGDSVRVIGDYAFYKCTSLTSVTIGSSVHTIGLFAFEECTSLTSVTIGNSVTTIEGCTFDNCKSLRLVYCKPTTPPKVPYGWVFPSNASGLKIYVPRNSVEAYKSASYWSDYASYIVGYDFE